MRVIEPSATIIENELEEISIYQRIAYCAGVCYQREPHKTEDEAREFCRKMVRIGHMSTLEMAVVHLAINTEDVFLPTYKYIKTSKIDKYQAVVTGSIRSFLEYFGGVGHKHMVGMFMGENYPLFYSGEIEKGYPVPFPVWFAEPHEIPWQHKHVAVRFIVNRAISHELVRHRPCSFLQESQRCCRYGDEVVFIRPEWWDDELLEMMVWEETMDMLEGTYQSMMQNGLTPQQARAVLPNSTKTELICYASLPQWKHIFKMRCSPAADPEMRRVMMPLEDQFKHEYPEAFA